MIALYRLDKTVESKIAALLDTEEHPVVYFYSIRSILDHMMTPFVVITSEPYAEEMASLSLPVVTLSIDLNDIKDKVDSLREAGKTVELIVVCASENEKSWLEKEFELQPDTVGCPCLFHATENVNLRGAEEPFTYLAPVWDTSIRRSKPPHGEWHLVEPSLSTIRRAVQQAVSLVPFTRDRLREKLLMGAVVDSLHDAVIAVDRQSRITLVNEQAKMLLGLSGDVLGRPITDYIPHSDMLRVLKTGRQELGDVATVLDRSIVINRIPVIVKDQVVGAVSNFKEISDIQKMEMSLRKKLHESGLEARYRLENIIGTSAQIRETKQHAALFAKSNATVLITGESGTGKELFAQGIHLESGRALGPFLAVNCAALPESLLESELFGYEEGAFTGAKKGGKPGLFELAHGGTLFLDEIGEMPLRIQVHLLRVLQERRVRRVGGERVIPVDVRIIVATNRNLEREIEKGQFRSDLYYRINMLKLEVPSLRERLDDIPALIDSMIQEMNEQHEQKIVTLDTEIYLLFQQHHWPGNVRELRNVVERMVLLSRDGMVHVEDVAWLFQGKKRISRTDDEYYGSLIPRFTEEMNQEASKIRDALEKAKHNRTVAAKALGMDRTTLWRKMKQYQIE
ncbi:sigma-54 interaction domain-containing protein [Brevibacillus invocatus]|uniref:sigma-54 interaction domain-containing protein n=1 Tax=Brevibacillus invocatus TaxID=173959 RepID=UPI002041C64F|nr:sigma 54-interacting transcriptional regulator [Brevibacillus invocatus]MCM3077648.1 sigma 54-interacting transcriptional regulator [Brevibacillus invocatus]MCM3428650.1 sigma 54-interacting transcriptional regulator [Brevibacillus invocatus]